MQEDRSVSDDLSSIPTKRHKPKTVHIVALITLILPTSSVKRAVSFLSRGTCNSMKNWNAWSSRDGEKICSSWGNFFNIDLPWYSVFLRPFSSWAKLSKDLQQLLLSMHICSLDPRTLCANCDRVHNTWTNSTSANCEDSICKVPKDTNWASASGEKWRRTSEDKVWFCAQQVRLDSIARDQMVSWPVTRHPVASLLSFCSESVVTQQY